MKKYAVRVPVSVKACTATLLNYIRQSCSDFPSTQVTIRRIGKKSGAHYIACEVTSGKR